MSGVEDKYAALKLSASVDVSQHSLVFDNDLKKRLGQEWKSLMGTPEELYYVHRSKSASTLSCASKESSE